MLERQPAYQPNPRNSITLDRYTGVASDIMRVNEPVADGFMRVSDLRKDIVIVKSAEERAETYDQIGNTRVATALIFGNRTQRPSLSGLSYDGDAWYVHINDSRLSRHATENMTPDKKFDEVFTEGFTNEVNAKIKELLVREKIIGQGYEPLHTLYSYLPFMLVPAGILQNPESMQIVLSKPDSTGILAAFIYSLSTCLNAASTGVNETMRLFWRALGGSKQDEPNHFNHPFIRQGMRGLLEAPLSTVPVDRVLRGALYLQMHGNKMIQATAKP
jgi:hypothetical protein